MSARQGPAGLDRGQDMDTLARARALIPAAAEMPVVRSSVPGCYRFMGGRGPRLPRRYSTESAGAFGHVRQPPRPGWHNESTGFPESPKAISTIGWVEEGRLYVSAGVPLFGVTSLMGPF